MRYIQTTESYPHECMPVTVTPCPLFIVNIGHRSKTCKSCYTLMCACVYICTSLTALLGDSARYKVHTVRNRQSCSHVRAMRLPSMTHCRQWYIEKGVWLLLCVFESLWLTRSHDRIRLRTPTPAMKRTEAAPTQVIAVRQICGINLKAMTYERSVRRGGDT